MDKFINGGIVKEITVHFKTKEDKIEVLDHLADYLDLNLYDMDDFNECLYLELKEDVLRANILSFLEEINRLGVYEDMEMMDKIESISENLENSTEGCVLNNCDEIFKDRYRMFDQFSFYDERYDMDILYYAFYFDGPYPVGGEFSNLLKYMHMLNKKVVQNPLRGSLCFGIN